MCEGLYRLVLGTLKISYLLYSCRDLPYITVASYRKICKTSINTHYLIYLTMRPCVISLSRKLISQRPEFYNVQLLCIKSGNITLNYKQDIFFSGYLFFFFFFLFLRFTYGGLLFIRVLGLMGYYLVYMYFTYMSVVNVEIDRFYCLSCNYRRRRVLRGE